MSSVQPNWLLLPDLARDEIMLKVGLGNLESLHRCRQVCTAWDEAIMKDIWGNSAKRNVIRAKIESDWGPEMWPADHQISHAKWLGKYISSRILHKLDIFYCRGSRQPLNCSH